jgi:signal transduction histidine kinase
LLHIFRVFDTYFLHIWCIFAAYFDAYLTCICRVFAAYFDVYSPRIYHEFAAYFAAYSPCISLHIFHVFEVYLPHIVTYNCHIFWHIFAAYLRSISIAVNFAINLIYTINIITCFKYFNLIFVVPRYIFYFIFNIICF